MLLNSWSITLVVISAAALFLSGGTVRTAIRILWHWDIEADTARQIQLEYETWLSALLMEYGMVLQLVSLLLLVLAADRYAQVLIGAMCATGAFLANDYGVPLLLVKIVGIFLYGFWIVLHRLDMSSEFLPLTKIKFWYALFLAPLLVLDMILLLLYLTQLQPDIITSCCGVVFGQASGDGKNLVGPVPVRLVMALFYGLAGLLFGLSLVLLKKTGTTALFGEKRTGIVFGLLWLLFFMLSLLVITAVTSSYIYRMPFHRCPFDILKREYHFIGYLIYLTLFGATFCGMSTGVASLFVTIPSLRPSVRSLQKAALRLILVLLPVFLVVVSWFPIVYLFADYL